MLNLTKSDKNLIEKFLDHKFGHPDCPALTVEEQIIFDQRIQDSDFKYYLEFSDELNKAIANEEAIKFEKVVQSVANDYHAKRSSLCG